MTAIYLDHQATTPTDPRVLQAMLPWMSRPANPHAIHSFGRDAAEAVETARRQVAGLVGADARQVFFTGGATEAANIAIRSLPTGSRVLASPIEHACVIETLASMGDSLDIAYAEVDGEGLLDADAIADHAVGFDVVVAMAVNNEIGTVQPMPEIGSACRLVGAALLTDITQAAGRIPVDLRAWDAQAAWLSSHKIYGPQGIGALVWRDTRPPQPLFTGGGQEHGVRPGTVATALAVGFGKACELAAAEMEQDSRHASALSGRFLDAIRSEHPDVVVNGSAEQRIPHNLNLAFEGVDADHLVAMLPGLAISTGSACSAGAIGTSHVLMAITSEGIAASSIRVGFGRSSTIQEVDRAAEMISEAVRGLTAGALRKVG
jgi:cysteine desulfurase